MPLQSSVAQQQGERARLLVSLRETLGAIRQVSNGWWRGVSQGLLVSNPWVSKGHLQERQVSKG